MFKLMSYYFIGPGDSISSLDELGFAGEGLTGVAHRSCHGPAHILKPKRLQHMSTVVKHLKFLNCSSNYPESSQAVCQHYSGLFLFFASYEL